MPFPYDLHHPDATLTLGIELDEISGICPLDGEWLAAVEHKTRDIYELRHGKIVSHFQSGKAGDSAGIVIVGRRAFVLDAQKRAIFEYKDFRKSMNKYKKHSLNLKKRADPDGLCYDSHSACLLVACKGSAKKGSSKRDVFTFDLAKRKRKRRPYFTINGKHLREEGIKEDFNPSGIAIHPTSREIYLLSAQGLKMVVRLSRNGKRIIDTARLDDKEYGRPEGIGFTDEKDLYVSSEAKGGRKATLYRFKQLSGQ